MNKIHASLIEEIITHLRRLSHRVVQCFNIVVGSKVKRDLHKSQNSCFLLLDKLQHPLTKPILCFLAFILPSMNRFNILFQKSSENTACLLYSEMTRLVRLYASLLLKTGTITAAEDDLTSLNFTRDKQLDDEDLGIGNDTWACISALEEEMDIKPFFRAVRDFDIATVKKMLKKFPFSDSILKDLGIINPEQVCSYSFSTVEKLAKTDTLHN